ncbi:MFS transporter [Roseomonas sp. PWR1]|uniref:MFS transporter n=1 Tax=Roseomonas nitratireducens TaxID=2820810 RepID=A0ABS4AV61_9PROT|nr:MFS transporter [Neoroseomonas nitratireducens]MBP0465260.1 MFS transporter [Neoroseomonas nitratireducens]
MAAIGAAVFAIGFSTTLAMPLFTAYADRDGGGAGGLAAAFIAYAGTLIVTAPLLGGLSDRIGRKPCVLAGLVLAGVSTLALVVAPGLAALAVARALQGLAIGLVAGGATAWAAELAGGPEAGRRAARVMAFGTAGSYGAGGLATLIAFWLLGQAEPPVTFWLHMAAVALLIPVVARLPDRRPTERVAWLRVPAFPRGTVASSFGMFAAWGVTGVTITSVPSALAAAGYPRLGPLAVCFMIVAGTAVQQAIGRWPARRLSLTGLPVLAAGAGLVILGTLGASLPLLLAGGGLVGSAAYGFLYVGALAAASEAASGADRARAAAGVFLIAHAGFCVPPLLTGLAVDAFGAPVALAGFWAGLAGLCTLLALLLLRRQG